MKRRDIIKKLEKNGFVLDRHGGNHDIYHNEKTNKRVPVGRHKEIDENLAKEIFKEAGL
ncbi:MAG: type II toxin-antitoxin system HicA family toxin [Oscillospiraceae bacterium]|nr:type II toxin-antitoxin system HicA family toxin [Oscillospiraceae bacterium]